ncbi:MAG: adenosylcobinamide-GDP ribazoletransferase [Alicyclobacillus sp.]|nr:adenosylcobinamide-GDP ribazoletransferase [Alicyclobacillus sp.]
MAMVRWFVLAVQFATVIPMPPVPNASDRDVRTSVLFLPVVGGFLGAILWGLQRLLTGYLPLLPATAVALTAYTLLTGALHLDGLLDTADAAGSRRSRDAALDIMKDSRIGAMGAVAAVLILVGKFAALSSLSPTSPGFFVVVPVWSRLAMVWSMAIAPAARGNGLGAYFARQIRPWVLVTATCLSAAVCVPLVSARDGLCLLIAVVGTTSLYHWWILRKFGGSTGDTYGALNEVVEWVGWMVSTGLAHWR